MEKIKLKPRSNSISSSQPSQSISQNRTFIKQGKITTTPHIIDSDRIPNTIFPEDRLLTPNMLFSSQNNKPNLKLLRQWLRRQGKLSDESAILLIRQAKMLLEKEPNMLTVHAPVVVLGDIHGQFYDLLHVMDLLGYPQKISYVFLGDYVDRGDYSTEVMFYLLALKICYPNRMFMLRGNHETRLMAEYMTFLLECNNKYSIQIYNEFIQLFDALPLCALIEGNVNGRVLCMHGGISPYINKLEDIAKINRFCEPGESGPLTDLLWSDPLPVWDPDNQNANSNVVGKDLIYEEWCEIEFVENTMRHTSYFYGKKALERFLKLNNLSTIVRGHQVQDAGYLEHSFLIKDRALPLCFTIFSAPNYCDQYNNQGALLVISQSPFDIKTFVWKDHPFQLPDFQDGFSFSLPYILEKIVDILQHIVMKVKTPLTKEEKMEELQTDELLKRKLPLLYAKSKLMKEKREMYRKVLEQNYHVNMSKFEKALLSDKQNEQYPSTDMIAEKQINHVGLLRRGASSPALLQRMTSDKSFLNNMNQQKKSVNTQKKNNFQNGLVNTTRGGNVKSQQFGKK